VAPSHQPLFTDAFLASHLAAEYAQFRGSDDDKGLRERLQHWASKDFQKETSAESDFVQILFTQTWGYWGAGTRAKTEGYNLYPRFPISGAGEKGGTGLADLALGWFGRSTISATAQAACEFKDVRSGLDKPQRRKGNDRSPVQQCADYLKEAAQRLYGNEPIQPTWGIISDMNELRLYWRRTMPSQFQQFFITKPAGRRDVVGLVDDGDEASFQRFVFWKLLRADMLLSLGGPSPLEKLIVEQGVHEHAIENSFYKEYHHYREFIFRALVESNPQFTGTRGKLVRLAQRFLDRCIFILFCEDMGAALNFPPNILKQTLSLESNDPHYDPSDTSIWHKIKRLFVSIRDGTPFGQTRINRFNGGLFAEEPELERLAIPNFVFCVKGQGSPEALLKSKDTLLFFSANYNFGVRGGDFKRSIGLYTLGRIFEQSITDLEFMEAKADGRPSLTELTKRKRDGVYYTPEWVTYFIVDETVGAHVRDIRRKHDLDDGATFTAAELEKYQVANARKKKAGPRLKPPESVIDYLNRLDAYTDDLGKLKVLDPACGSGAFLIQALELLLRERSWATEERERITLSGTLFDIDKITKAILTENLYGVDINAESVEISRLALWLRSALPDRPLCSLDNNIRHGNSLVGPEFYQNQNRQAKLFTEEQKEHINAFDWKAAFPDVFSRPGDRAGFDCVIGNPPYVKLQNFKQVDSAVATYLVEARRSDDTPLYESTQTSNFDLYLPFVEKGMELLNESGRMGFIAPSVWLVNEYGIGLRRKLSRTRRLERWVDFGDYQVFAEAITYTALQFFRGKPAHTISCRFAPDGNIAGTEWSTADAFIPYSSLDAESAWTFLPHQERQLLTRLNDLCVTLGAEHTIAVGVQTSADHIYHLSRVGPGRYLKRAHGTCEGLEVELEDAIMRPLVSGEEAKRYIHPSTQIYILFPYDDTGERTHAFSVEEMARRFPKAWAYLRTNERELRAREGGAFDDDAWFRFGRNQNIDKQKLPKLVVPRLTVRLGTAVDAAGAVCLDNVDANAVLADDVSQLWFIAGVLNGSVSNFVWRLSSKPFLNNFRAANKQFISPLPIPPATNRQRAQVAASAKDLQRLHTERRAQVIAIDRRLGSKQTTDDERSESWLWADVGSTESWKAQAPTELKGRQLTVWAKEKLAAALQEKLQEIDTRLHAGAVLTVREAAGELGLDVDGIPVISDLFVEAFEVPFIAAQWRQKLRKTNVTEAFKAKQLVRMLLNLRASTQDALRKQVIEADVKLRALDEEIAQAERAMDELLYSLYKLTPDERALVERGRR
jgi:hypothetical protein